MDQSGAEVAVVGICVYGDALEEASSVLAQGDEALGLGELGELQNLASESGATVKPAPSGEARKVSTTCVFSSSKTEQVA